MVSIEHFDLAPPVKVVDGLLAVPIDIRQLDAYTVFDMATCKSHVSANIIFLTSKTDGNPLFDLGKMLRKQVLTVKL